MKSTDCTPLSGNPATPVYGLKSALRSDSGCSLISLLKRYNRLTVNDNVGSLPNEVLFSLTVQSLEFVAVNSKIRRVVTALGVGVKGLD